MKPSLQLRPSNQLAMTPQLQQAIRLLQLSVIDLQVEIQTALETNTMLESQETLFSSYEIENKERNSFEKMETQPFRYHRESCGNELETLNAAALSLQQHLLWQLQLTPFSEIDRLIGTVLIDAINEDGFMTTSIDDIHTTLKPLGDIDKAEIEAVLHRIQQFEPFGVGARDLKECLILQLNALPSRTLLKKKTKELIHHYLELLAKKDYPTLKRRLRVTSEELQEIIHFIQKLNPRPGTEIGSKAPEYLVPDVYTYKKEGVWQVKLNREWTPKLRINTDYAQLIRRADQSADNQFLKNQLQEAKWFLKSINNRNETLLKVAQCIVEHQQDFFENGEESMRPLVLHDVAHTLNLHESTVSRVTTAKYLHCPKGTFELKYFFSNHLSYEGNNSSSTAIRALIKKLIHNEAAKKPLSDNKLVFLLKEQGIKIARRTIAKYREAMSIPPSHERKQLL